MKVFLAHPKGCTDSQIADWKTEIVRWARTDDIDAEVVTGLEDFNANIAIEGNFDTWARGVPTRRDTYTGRPVYGAIVVPHKTIGKATSIIASEALKANTPVIVMTHDETDVTFQHVIRVEVVDHENYIDGWELVPA